MNRLGLGWVFLQNLPKDKELLLGGVGFSIYIVVLGCNIKQLQTKSSNALLSQLIQPPSELAFCKLEKIVHLHFFFFSQNKKFEVFLTLISFF